MWLRQAQADDAAFLASSWRTHLREAESVGEADILAIIEAAQASADEQLLIAEYDGERAGAALLRVTTVSPLNLEPILSVVAPFVVATQRRKGVGRALLNAATTFADERGIATMATVASASSREANRYFSRLGLGPHALVRTAPVALVASRLAAAAGQRMPRPRQGAKLADVMAARRAVRRTPAAR
ncbi:hypothetical protein Back2_05310 [Nocardioides baekrokdamisoli]|uniref:N-acetyltransferase domain-containing protein n=1 Tax=Nocardioides baekrokdamisoli TaxID=1804624 RepID=A0A3G9IYJ6_9ACTN|nr:hypothetical protein Back2_05310 [Nocardioides baekrokdamisoli]